MPDSRWEPVDQINPKHALRLRAALPARTARHVRAEAQYNLVAQIADCSEPEMLQGYAFAQVNDRWQYVASSGDRRPYE